MRAVVLDAIREQVRSPKRIAVVRKTIAERLRDHSKGIDAEPKHHRDRLERTAERIKGLVSFIADGDRLVSTLRDREVQAKASPPRPRPPAERRLRAARWYRPSRDDRN